MCCFLVPISPEKIDLADGSDPYSVNYTIFNSTEPNELEGYVVRLSKWDGKEFTPIDEQNNTIGGSGYSESGIFTSLLKGVVYKISVFTDDVCFSSQLSTDSTDEYFQAGRFYFQTSLATTYLILDLDL